QVLAELHREPTTAHPPASGVPKTTAATHAFAVAAAAGARASPAVSAKSDALGPRASFDGPVPASPPSVIARTAGELNGREAAQVEAIKAAILPQQRFLGELVEHVCRWELDGAEMRLYFRTESKALAEMLQARDPIEKLRTISSQVMGQPLRVCVKLEPNQA